MECTLFTLIPESQGKKHRNVTSKKQDLPLEPTMSYFSSFMIIIYSLMDKAKVLETFLEEETQNDRETKKPSRDMDRSGALRKVGYVF